MNPSFSPSLPDLYRNTLESLPATQHQNSSAINVTSYSQKDLTDLRRIETDLSGFRAWMSLRRPQSLSILACTTAASSIRDLDNGASAIASGSGLRSIEALPVRFENPFAVVALTGRCPGLSRSHERSRRRGEAAHGPMFYAYDRAHWAPIVGSRGSRKDRPGSTAVVPCSVTGILAPRVDLEAKLVDRSSGKEIPLAIQSANKIKKADVDIYYLEFSLIGVPAGDYDFVVCVEEAGSGLISESKTIDEDQTHDRGVRIVYSFVALVLIGPLCLIALSRDESLSLRGRFIGAGIGLESAAVRIDLNGPSTDEERARLYRHWSLADIERFHGCFPGNAAGYLAVYWRGGFEHSASRRSMGDHGIGETDPSGQRISRERLWQYAEKGRVDRPVLRHRPRHRRRREGRGDDP